MPIIQISLILSLYCLKKKKLLTCGYQIPEDTFNAKEMHDYKVGSCAVITCCLSFLQVEAEGHGSWAAEDSVPAEERQEGSREEEISGR